MDSSQSPQQPDGIDISTYEKKQRQNTLNIILVIIIIGSLIFGVVNYFFYQAKETAYVFFATMILCLPTIWLNQRGFYWLTGLIASFLVFFSAHFNLVDGAGIRDPGVVAYPIIILIGGLLFGKKAIPLFTIVGIASLATVVGLDSGFSADEDRLLIISILLIAGAGATRTVLGNTNNNIKRLKESEENLRQALEQSRKHVQRINGIIETVPEGVLLLNSKHQIILANQNAHHYLATLAPDYQQGSALKQVGSFPVDDLIRSASDGWQEIVVQESEQIFEAAVRSVHKVPPPYKNWVLVLRDATLERKQQESLQEQVRLAMVGQLASGIAHDFRNILSVISTYSQIAQKRSETDKLKEYHVVIQDQVKDAARLIDQILDYGRRTIMQREAVDAVTLIQDTVNLLKRTLPSNIAIKFIQEPGSYILIADKTRLQQVLMNLAVNARDAMPNGGVLQFILSAHKPAAIAWESEAKTADWLILQVIDTGEGIHPGTLSQIFEPFFTTKETGKGTGLGLAQVYGIVKQHEGEITVESEQGKGTTFYLYFPNIVPSRQPST
jgi:signal transduction histidine kinase